MASPDLRGAPGPTGGVEVPPPMANMGQVDKEAVERAINLVALAQLYPSAELIEMAQIALEEANEITGASIAPESTTGPSEPKRSTKTSSGDKPGT